MSNSMSWLERRRKAQLLRSNGFDAGDLRLLKWPIFSVAYDGLFLGTPLESVINRAEQLGVSYEESEDHSTWTFSGALSGKESAIESMSLSAQSSPPQIWFASFHLRGNYGSMLELITFYTLILGVCFQDDFSGGYDAEYSECGRIVTIAIDPTWRTLTLAVDGGFHE